jgi:hypothetical protein
MHEILARCASPVLRFGVSLLPSEKLRFPAPTVSDFSARLHVCLYALLQGHLHAFLLERELCGLKIMHMS